MFTLNDRSHHQMFTIKDRSPYKMFTINDRSPQPMFILDDHVIFNRCLMAYHTSSATPVAPVDSALFK